MRAEGRKTTIGNGEKIKAAAAAATSKCNDWANREEDGARILSGIYVVLLVPVKSFNYLDGVLGEVHKIFNTFVFTILLFVERLLIQKDFYFF